MPCLVQFYEMNIIKNDTCFAVHKRLSVTCEKSDCRYWISNCKTQNCSLIAAAKGGMTLEQIGDVFNLTRMRICQIEKSICKKISEQLLEQPIH